MLISECSKARHSCIWPIRPVAIVSCCLLTRECRVGLAGSQGAVPAYPSCPSTPSLPSWAAGEAGEAGVEGSEGWAGKRKESPCFTSIFYIVL